MGSISCKSQFLLTNFFNFFRSCLQDSPIIFILSSLPCRFQSLSLDKCCFFLLFEFEFCNLHLLAFKFLDYFDSCKFQTLSYENLKDRLNFQFKIVQIWVNSVLNLSCFVFSSWNRHIKGIRRSINKVIWLDIKLIYHVFVILKLL